MAAEYRAVSRLSGGTDEMWTLQVKRKFFGLTWWGKVDAYCYNPERALAKAKMHVKRKGYEAKIVNFGVLS